MMSDEPDPDPIEHARSRHALELQQRFRRGLSFRAASVQMLWSVT